MTPIPDFKIVDDPIAKDRWSDTDGNQRASVRAFVGVGPVDALMNAMSVVKAFAEQIGQFTAAYAVRVTTLVVRCR